MKAKIFACSISLALVALTGCSSSQTAVNRSLGQAEATRILASENTNLDSKLTASANSKLDAARALKEDGKTEEAQAMAEQGELELRLAIAKSENESVKNEDKKLQEALNADEERKALYQSILDKETKK
jgi:osmotically-inducible protein OsmY